MNSIDLLEELEKYPVFDMAQFVAVAGLDPASAKVRLFRMRKQGRVIGLQRNSFTVLKDPVLVASRIVWPSYISLWYALSHHGLTMQVPQGITVLTSRQTFRRQLEFRGTRITFVLVPPSFLYGYDRIDLGGHEVFMAYPEKAILDALHVGGISASELLDVLMGHGRDLDMGRLDDYLQGCKDGKAVRRLGALLQRSGLRVHFRPRGVKGRAAIPLDRALPPEGPLDRRWGVIDNLEAVR